MPTHRELPRDQATPEERWRALLETAIHWRPATVLGYLVVVAVLGILVALAVIVGVELHLLHRLF